MSGGQADRYSAIREDEDGGAATVLGTVHVGADGMLVVDAVLDDPDERLAQVAGELNARAHLNVKTPPGPGAPRFALASRVVERGTPDFLPALREYLAKYHSIRLQPS